MKCPVCGAENAEGKTFCGDCGRKMTVDPGVSATTIGLRLASFALVLMGLVMVWKFIYYMHSGSEYEYDYWGADDWADTVLQLIVGLLVIVLGFLSYPRQK